jgi:hypothetical protein
MFEIYYKKLLTYREEFWKLNSLTLRNRKLSIMAHVANICGIDLVEFITEYEGEKAVLEFAKAKIVLQKQTEKQTEKQAEKQKATFKCPFCEYYAESSKSLSGHLKRHSPKYEVFNLKTQSRAV